MAQRYPSESGSRERRAQARLPSGAVASRGVARGAGRTRVGSFGRAAAAAQAASARGPEASILSTVKPEPKDSFHRCGSNSATRLLG